MNYLFSGADISQDLVYRYTLIRDITPGNRTVVFVGLNPSTADALKDDPTIRREVGFAMRWGFNRLVKLNLYAYRETKPKKMFAAAKTGVDIVGPRNPLLLMSLIHHAEMIVLAWGRAKLDKSGVDLARKLWSFPQARCLGVTQSGAPVHPLYLPSITEIQYLKEFPY